MSITAYVGLPGSGKSYGVVKNVIAPALCTGINVATNIPLNKLQIFQYVIDEGADPTDVKLHDLDIRKAKDDLGYLDSFPHGTVFVIDEVWRLWPSGMNARQIPESHKSFFAEHRHKVGSDGRSNQIILVTQDLSQIAAFCRNLVEETFQSVKLNHVGMDKRYRIDVYQGAVTGAKPPESRLIRSLYGSYNGRFFKLYQSHTQSDTGKAGNESKVDSRASILRHPLILLGLPIGAMVGIGGLAMAIGNFTHAVTGEIESGDRPGPGVEMVTSDGAIIRKMAPLPPVNTGATMEKKNGDPFKSADVSDDWRIVAVLDATDKTLVYLQGRAFMRQIPFDSCKRISGTMREVECLVDGERVTLWSGPQYKTSFGQASVEGASPGYQPGKPPPGPSTGAANVVQPRS
jgi:zona occludens toxin